MHPTSLKPPYDMFGNEDNSQPDQEQSLAICESCQTSSECKNSEVVELLRIAKGYLPRIRLEYDRAKAELNSCKAELSNIARTYKQFVDRNIELKKRENYHQMSINE